MVVGLPTNPPNLFPMLAQRSRTRKRPAPERGGGDGVGGNLDPTRTTTTTSANAATSLCLPTFGSIAKRARRASVSNGGDGDGGDDDNDLHRDAEEELGGPHRGGLSSLVAEDENSRLSTLTERSDCRSDGAVAGNDYDDFDLKEVGRSSCGGSGGDGDGVRRRLDLEVEALTAAVDGWGGNRGVPVGGQVESGAARIGGDGGGGGSGRGGGWCLSGLRSWRERVASEVGAAVSADADGDDGVVDESPPSTTARAAAVSDPPGGGSAVGGGGGDRRGDGGGLGRRALRDRRREAQREVMRALARGSDEGGIK